MEDEIIPAIEQLHLKGNSLPKEPIMMVTEEGSMPNPEKFLNPHTLEHIISFLPLSDLVQASAVSRQFQVAAFDCLSNPNHDLVFVAETGRCTCVEPYDQKRLVSEFVLRFNNSKMLVKNPLVLAQNERLVQSVRSVSLASGFFCWLERSDQCVELREILRQFSNVQRLHWTCVRRHRRGDGFQFPTFMEMTAYNGIGDSCTIELPAVRFQAACEHFFPTIKELEIFYPDFDLFNIPTNRAQSTEEKRLVASIISSMPNLSKARIDPCHFAAMENDRVALGSLSSLGFYTAIPQKFDEDQFWRFHDLQNLENLDLSYLDLPRDLMVLGMVPRLKSLRLDTSLCRRPLKTFKFYDAVLNITRLEMKLCNFCEDIDYVAAVIGVSASLEKLFLTSADDTFEEDDSSDPPCRFASFLSALQKCTRLSLLEIRFNKGRMREKRYHHFLAHFKEIPAVTPESLKTLKFFLPKPKPYTSVIQYEAMPLILDALSAVNSPATVFHLSLHFGFNYVTLAGIGELAETMLKSASVRELHIHVLDATEISKQIAKKKDCGGRHDEEAEGSSRPTPKCLWLRRKLTPHLPDGFRIMDAKGWGDRVFGKLLIKGQRKMTAFGEQEPKSVEELRIWLS